MEIKKIVEGMTAPEVSQIIDENFKEVEKEMLQTKKDGRVDFAISDEEGNNILEIKDGHLKTKNFDSREKSIETIVLSLPENPTVFYSVCNDLDKSNRWGIGSRNYGNSIYLDHFFMTSNELGLRFAENNSVYQSFSQSIKGAINVWNNNNDVFEQSMPLKLNNGQSINVKLRTTLNSATVNKKPIVLQIGDSVTEGWFANYPKVENAPVQSYAWAKYCFQQDKKQYGSGFDCMFVGHKNKASFNFNGVQGTACACGYGGKDAVWYNTSSESPFYNPSTGKFSLSYYLSKYKTLADDGVTRLEVGTSAGANVSDVNAYDLCTPNIVVIQLGMNGTFEGWKTNVPSIIQSIKNEYPNMTIIISVLDAAVCNFPSLYPDWQDIYFNDYGGAKACLLNCYKYAIDNLQNEANGIFVVYSGAVMPMPYSCNVREITNDLSDLNPELKRFVGVDAIERVKHPSLYGHQAVGYQLYSVIKYVSLKHN